MNEKDLRPLEFTMDIVDKLCDDVDPEKINHYIKKRLKDLSEDEVTDAIRFCVEAIVMAVHNPKLFQNLMGKNELEN